MADTGLILTDSLLGGKMAVAITSPAAASTTGDVGVSDEDLLPQVIAGEPFDDIVGTTTTSGGNVNIEITADEANCAVKLTVTATLLAFTTADILEYTPYAAGKYHIKVTDVTSGDSSEQIVLVEQSEGV